ncbi:MAG: hypothetical protein ACI9MR_002235 [Myxococcota bacterium]|jgi:hypothetical protein
MSGDMPNQNDTKAPVSAPSDATGPAGADLATLGGRGRLPAELRHASGIRKIDHILSLPDVADFVETLATEELYLLIKDIGRNDAYPLLEYATREQMRGLVDIDAWNKHDLQLDRWLGWFELAEAVSFERVQEFLSAADDELLEWLFIKDVTVHGSDLDKDFVPDDQALFQTPDFMYWVTVERGHILEDRLPHLMKMLWATDVDRIRLILQQARFDVPASVEAYMDHFRNGRLADMGFSSPTEALAVFSTISLKSLRTQVREHLEEYALMRPPATGSVAFDLALVDVTPPPFLGAALALLDETARNNVALAMTMLVNKVFMAQTRDLSRTDDLPVAARHAAGLVSMGLAYLADESPEVGAEILQRIGCQQVFQAGHTLTIEQRLRAVRLRARSGAALGYTLFGSPTDDTIAAAARPQPLLFEGLVSPGSVTVRPFSTLAELARVEVALDDAEATIGFFEQSLGYTPEVLEQLRDSGLNADAVRRVHFATLFRTGLAQTLLTDTFSFAPLDREDLVAFSRAAFAKDGTRTPTFDAALKTLTEALPEAVGRFVRHAIEQLTDAIGGVRPEAIETRYASDLFLTAAE